MRRYSTVIIVLLAVLFAFSLFAAKAHGLSLLDTESFGGKITVEPNQSLTLLDSASFGGKITVEPPPNNPPQVSNPSPADDATGIPLQPTLSVDVSDPDGDSMDVFFYNASSGFTIASGANNIPNGTASVTWDDSGQSQGCNQYNTTYEWYVYVSDGTDVTYYPAWTSNNLTFTTVNKNQSPSVSNPSPSNGTTGVNPEPILSVDISDLEGDNMTLQFRTNDTVDESWVNLTTESSGLSNGTYNVDTSGTGYYQDYNMKYYWRAVCTDPNGSNNTVIETYYFTTRGAFEPSQPENFTADPWNLTSIALYWDRVGGPTDKTVVIRKTGSYPSSPSDGTVAFNTTDTGVWKWDDGLSYDTKYYYAAYGYNETDNQFSGGAAQVNATTYDHPNQPSNPTPANGSTNQELEITFEWNASDPNNGDMTFDFYIDTSTPLTSSDIAAHNISNQYYSPGTLSTSTTYYWKVVAWNEWGGHNESERWNLTTRASPPDYSILNTNTSTWYRYLLNATSHASNGNILEVYSNYTVDETVIVNKSITIKGMEAGARMQNAKIEVSDVNISNLELEDTINISTKQSLSDIVFYNCTWDGLLRVCRILNDTSNLSFLDCDIDNTLLDFEHPWNTFVNLTNITIDNCSFSNYSRIRFSTFSIAGISSVSGMTISNSNWTGIYSSSCIDIDGQYYAFDNIDIHNCSFAPSSSSYAVNLLYLNNLTFKNNTLHSNYGITFNNIIDGLIFNNLFNASTSNSDVSSCTNLSWNISKTSGTNIINGPYLGGNYWNDYTGSDGDGDGIGDSSYTIASGEVDYLPLVEYNYNPSITLNSPSDAASDVSTSPTLNVSIYDQDGDSITVYFYNATNDNLIGTDTISSGDGNATATWNNLAYGTTYSWYVTANDSTVNVTSNTWSFTTSVYNNPPSVTLKKPPNGWTSVPIEPDLTFELSDQEGDGIWTEVYAKQSGGSWSLLSSNNLSNGTWTVTYSGANSLNTKYYWSVNATNDNSTWTNTSIWNFTTRALNEPAPPYNVSVVAYNATNIAYWYDIGQAADKTVIVRNNSSQPTSATDGTVIYNNTGAGGSWSYDTSLEPNSTYYYAFYSYNTTGGLSDNAWTCNATTYLLPDAPYNPNPANGTTNFNRTNVNISWSCIDPDVNGFAIDHYNIYLGTSDPPGYIANTVNTYYEVGNLNYGTTYYWYIEAVNNKSDKNSSEIWQFTTESANLPSPPSDFNATHGGYYWLNVTWTPNSGADKTYIRWDTTNHTDWTRTDGNFLCNISGNYKQHTGLSKHTTYYYAAWSWNSAGFSSSYVTTNGIVDNRLPTVSSMYPSNNSNQVSVATEMSFYIDDNDNDTLEAYFYLYKPYNNNWTIIETQNWAGLSAGQTLTYNPSLSGGQNYRWFVKVYDGYDYYSSPYYYFTTNNPPSFSSISPSDGATDVPVNISELSAYISDGDGDLIDWQIWMYTDPPYGYSANGTDETNGTKNCAITSDLNYSTTYTWHINTTDGIDYSNISYQFTTESYNYAPSISNRNPPNGASVHSPVNLSAYVSDQDGGTVNVTFQQEDGGTYTDLYTWTGASVNQTFSWDWGGLSTGVTYTWRIMVDDGVNTVTTSNWTFTITVTNYPPNAPSNPTPSDGNTSVGHEPTLSWDCSDPDGDTLIYDVYFGTDPSPDAGEKVASNQTGTTYDPSVLESSTTYYWQIVAWDTYNASNTSSIWSFTTQVNHEPSITNPSPSNGTTGNPFNPALEINISDSDGDNMNLTIYTNATGGWTIVKDLTGVYDGRYSATTSNMGDYNTTYYWRVEVDDGFNGTNASTYHFTTITMGAGYSIEIRYEENGTLASLDENATYELVAHLGSPIYDTERTTVSSNPFSIDYDVTPSLLRLYVTPENWNQSYFRTLIPDNKTGQIIFYIPFNESRLQKYRFELDDKTGMYSGENTFFRLYYYNNGSKWTINEDYWDAQNQVTVWLIYQNKYIGADVVDDREEYSRWVEADEQVASATTRTITITVVEQNQAHAIYEFMWMDYYINNETGNVIFEYNANQGTRWVNVTLYRVNPDNTKTEIYQGNYSTNTFTIARATNVSRLHTANVVISHKEIDISEETNYTHITRNTVSLSLKAYPFGQGPDWGDINEAFTITFGDTELNILSVVIAMILIAIAFAFGPAASSAGMIACGLFLAFMQVKFGFTGISSVLAILFIFLGGLLLLREKGGI